MVDVFLGAALVSLGAGMVVMTFDLFTINDWEYSDAITPLIVFPILTASVVTGLFWIARATVLG